MVQGLGLKVWDWGALLWFLEGFGFIAEARTPNTQP